MSTTARRFLRRTSHVLVWAVLLALGALLALAVVVPKVGGATPYTVLTGSMRPDLPPGTLIVVRPADPDRIGVGTVVTYQLRSGEPEVVTHRVVEQAVDRDGKPLFRTQGDANHTPDPGWVRPVQIKGTLWYAVPWVGYLTTFLTGEHRHMLVGVAAVALFGYALAMVGLDARDGVRRRRREARQPVGQVRHG